MSGSARGWGTLPNTVVRDTRLSDAEIVVLAYRVTFVGRYGLNETHLSEICKGNGRGHSGLGKNSARVAISRLVQLKYLVRAQPKPSGGVYGFAVDHLRLPACDPLDQKRVYRAWFDGTWLLEEIAAYILLRAGLQAMGRDGSTVRLQWLSTDDLRQRFGWSREKTLATLKALLVRGRIEQEDLRENGTFRGTRYRARPFGRPAAGDGDGGQRIAGRREDERHTYESDVQVELNNTLDSVRESLPSEDSTHKSIPTPSHGEGGLVDLEALEVQCLQHDELLGWVQELEESTGAEFATMRTALRDFDEESLRAVLDATDLNELATRLETAADNRIRPALRGPRGAYCVAYMAAIAMSCDSVDEAEPCTAVDDVLALIQNLIGARKGRWLNSFKLIGIRLLGRL
jgi:hypothetical protein